MAEISTQSAVSTEGHLKGSNGTSVDKHAQELDEKPFDIAEGLSLNFSRKRAHDAQHNQDPSQDLREDASTSHTPKRSRSSDWPLTAEKAQDAQGELSPRHLSPTRSTNKRHVSTPGRPSKFHEASMHDRASEKPPSAFMRVFQSNSNDASVDHLMEDYIDATNGTATVRLPGKSVDRRAQSKGLTHHPNQSIATTGTEESRQSGIFRFGRSIAASFNPMNIWQKVATNWREAREELIDERHKQWVERQAKAERAYAELKKSGMLGAQGSGGIPKGTKVFAPGYTAPAKADNMNHRDSAISMDESRPSKEIKTETQASSSLEPAPLTDVPIARKSSFHFRTPSLTNLKKVRSEITLSHKRDFSTSRSPEKQLPDTPDAERTLRKAQSKKDLLKQQKLTKRVSDLEAKLGEARRELSKALGAAPPVPPLPTELAETHRPTFKQRSSSPVKKPFVPGALASLPSERLLHVEQLDEIVGITKGEEVVTESHQVSVTTESVLAESGLADLRKNGGTFFVEEDSPLKSSPAVKPQNITSFETATSTKDSIFEPRTTTHGLSKKPSKNTPIDIWADKPESTTPARKPPTKKSTTKKRKSSNRDGLSYKPGPDTTDDDAEWAAATNKTPKKKRVSETTTSPKGKKNTDLPKSHPSAPASNGNGLTIHANIPIEVDPTVHFPADSSDLLVHSDDPAPSAPTGPNQPALSPGLDTVHEEFVAENSTVSIIALADDSKRTAFATPSHPSRSRASAGGRSRSASPDKTPAGRSPPPARGCSRALVVEEGEVVRAVPGGGDVPGLPGGGKAARGREMVEVVRENFEWPDDVF